MFSADTKELDHPHKPEDEKLKQRAKTWHMPEMLLQKLQRHTNSSQAVYVVLQSHVRYESS